MSSQGLAIQGRKSILKVSDDGGSTFLRYGGIVDVTMNISVDELECTSHDSNGAREYLPNHHDVTMDVSGRWLDGDPGQEVVLSAIFSKLVLNFEFFMIEDAGSGKKKFSGTCFATAANPTGPLDDTGNMDVTFRCSGVIISTQ
jgi:predicted secreted protein